MDVRSRFPLSPHWLWQLRRRFFSVNPMSEVMWDINESRAGWGSLCGSVIGLVISLLWHGAILLLLMVLVHPPVLSALELTDPGFLAVLCLLLALMWTKGLSLRLGNIHHRRMATRRDLLIQLTASPTGAADLCMASIPMRVSLILPWLLVSLLFGWVLWIAERGLGWLDGAYLVLSTGVCLHLLARMPAIGMEANLRGPQDLWRVRGLRLGLAVWITLLILPGILETIRGDALARAIPLLGFAALFVHAAIEYHSRQARARIPTHLQTWADAEWEKSCG